MESIFLAKAVSLYLLIFGFAIVINKNFVKEFSEVRYLINNNASSILKEYQKINEAYKLTFNSNVLKELGRSLADIQKNALQSISAISDIYRNQIQENSKLLYENI